MMKIYERLVMDWDGGIIEEISYEYDGPVALAGGGGGKKRPQVQPAPPAPEPTKEAAKESDSEAVAGNNEAKRKAKAASGMAGTNVTGGALGGDVATQKKSLMGQ